MIKCPATYFGKGENYNLQDATPDELQKFNEDFEKWERENPDDPTGEIALEAYKRNGGKASSSVEETPVASLQIMMDTPADLRISLPFYAIEKLKNHARLRKRRPRDIIQEWILKNC